MKGLLEVLNMIDRMVEIQDIFDSGTSVFEKALDKVALLVSEKLKKPSASQAREIVQDGFERFVEKINGYMLQDMKISGAVPYGKDS